MKKLLLGCAMMLAAMVPATVGQAAPSRVEQAVQATAGRSPDNVALDASRKPAELLRFFGLRSGMQVADMFGINGYWAEIMAPAVGPRGRVTVWQPTQFYTAERRSAFLEGAGKNPNVQLLVSPFEAPELPANSFDFMLINLDYHDVYWQSQERGIPRMEPDAWLKRVHAAMKPGGIVGVVDHAARRGSDPRQSVDELHRIDEAVVIADFRRAGFEWVASTPLLRNPADDRTKNVFDKAVRGQTDRFVLKFRKPRGARR